MEYWDLYDKDRNKLDKIVMRGECLNDDEYHLVVNVWIKNKDNKFLISQRTPNKPHPLMWECTGGSALAGEDSLMAGIREAKEELGVTLSSDNAKFIGWDTRYYPNCPDILEVWLFLDDTPIEDVKIQEEEVVDVMWASVSEIKKLSEEGKFLVNPYFLDVLNSVDE